jgi:hypothetical protein
MQCIWNVTAALLNASLYILQWFGNPKVESSVLGLARVAHHIQSMLLNCIKIHLHQFRNRAETFDLSTGGNLHLTMHEYHH